MENNRKKNIYIYIYIVQLNNFMYTQNSCNITNEFYFNLKNKAIGVGKNQQ